MSCDSRIQRRRRVPRRARVRSTARRARAAGGVSPDRKMNGTRSRCHYTSGTTGNPKGVVTHHRGAYLNAVCNAVYWSMPQFPVTCGRCRCFTATAGVFPGRWRCSAARRCACARSKPAPSWTRCACIGVDHYCGAPIVHNLLINADARLARRRRAAGARHGRGRRAAGGDDRGHAAHRLRPDPRLRTHRDLRSGGRGGASSRPGRRRALAEQARLNGRQGVRYVAAGGHDRAGAADDGPVPANGESARARSCSAATS